MRLIDADELKELFPDNGEGSWTYNITARMYIDNAPTVKERTEYGTDGKPYILSISNGSEYSRPTGVWIKLQCDYAYKCSLCGYIDFKDNYCPNCGAKMKGVEEEGDDE